MNFNLSMYMFKFKNMFKHYTLPDAMPLQYLEDWSSHFPPATITLHDVKTGRQIQEPSLVAAKIQSVERASIYPSEDVIASDKMLERYLAAGSAALKYQNTPDVVVFSPLRQGQIAFYDAAEFMLKSFMERVSPGYHLWKFRVCIYVQPQTTQVEERAIVDAALQAGAGRVFLYKHSLSKMLGDIPKYLRKAIFIHIEPQD